jgi:ubiquinol-cytochrome c reductase cytochrome b subunit
VRSARFRPVYRVLFWMLVVTCLVLGWCGKQLPEGIYLTISRAATAYYFLHFLVLLPLLGFIERPRPLPYSISRPVIEPAVKDRLGLAPALRGEATP